MSKRVVLDENGLKVSKPGFDADTATLPDLQFSPDFRMMKITESGSVGFPSASSNFTSNTGTTVTLLETYSVPPHVRFSVVYDNLNGGANQNRADMQSQGLFLVGLVLAAPVTTRYDSPAGLNVQNFRANTYCQTSTTALTIANQVGSGTLYYEIYEEVI